MAPGTAAALPYGAGADVSAYRSKELKLAPYFDANGRASGFGLHAGLLADLTLGAVELSAKGEWRRTKAPYQPEYFDVAYGIERYDVERVGGGAVAKADQALPTSNGWRGELRLRTSMVALALAASTRARGLYDCSGVLDLDFGKFDLGVLGAARGIESGGAEKLLIAGEARYRITPFFFGWAQGGRVYRVESAAGGFQAVPVTQLGLGLGAAVAP
jgi:hypothetical protein